MRRLRGWLAMSVFVSVWACMAVRADEEKEEKIPLDKVPKAVLKAVKNKFKDAKLVGAEKENENGKLVYEITIKHKDDSIEVIVTPEGKILACEKVIAVKDLPAAVLKAVEAKYPKADIKKAEEITADDKITYEVLLLIDKKKLEVVLDPSGKIVKEEKEESEAKEKEKKKDKDK
jgi:uncharacterized membrane protein YkoI